MGQPERSLTSLGRHVAELQDQAPEAQLDRKRGRARLLREEATREPRSRRGALVLAFAAALALALVVVVALRSPAPLRFAVGPGQNGVVGAWIAAPPGEPLPIQFSDGSALHLAPAGRARVAAVSADGAEIALERGSLELAIVHKGNTKWTVHVGPFAVRVIGTRFEASWDPLSERCTIALHEGAIVVSGPVVGEARAVRAGEKLLISPANGTLEQTFIDAKMTAATPSSRAAAEPAPSALPASEPSALPSAEPSALPASEPSAPRAPASATAALPREEASWRALSREGKYKEALAAAEREGFAAICAAAGARDLQALGDAARLGGDSARAAQALGALRSRFAGSPEAASAAFLLGRIAQDRNKDNAAAAAWFTRYLSEQPAGAFAAEAAGRLVEAKDRGGDSAGARRAAERYLAAYPGGSHAAYASSVLARSENAGSASGSAAPASAAAEASAAPLDAGAAVDPAAP